MVVDVCVGGMTTVVVYLTKIRSVRDWNCLARDAILKLPGCLRVIGICQCQRVEEYLLDV